MVPAEYRPDAPDYLVAQILEGRTMREICQEDAMPSVGMVRRWLTQDDGLKMRYLDAVRIKAVGEADALIAIADGTDQPQRVLYTEEVENEDGEMVTRKHYSQEADTSRDRLRVDTRLKVLEKLEPAIFGAKVEHGHNVTGELQQMLRAAMNKGHGLPGEKVIPNE